MLISVGLDLLKGGPTCIRLLNLLFWSVFFLFFIFFFLLPCLVALVHTSVGVFHWAAMLESGGFNPLCLTAGASLNNVRHAGQSVARFHFCPLQILALCQWRLPGFVGK